MGWFDLVKSQEHLAEWWTKCMRHGYFIDMIYMDDPKFPKGRPWHINARTGRYRIFPQQNETDWSIEQEKAGTPKSTDNPYYAPRDNPDEYADFMVNAQNNLIFLDGNLNFWHPLLQWYYDFVNDR